MVSSLILSILIWSVNICLAFSSSALKQVRHIADRNEPSELSKLAANQFSDLPRSSEYLFTNTDLSLQNINSNKIRAYVSPKAYHGCKDPLKCYINSLVIDIPDVCINIKNEKVCISDSTCSNIDLLSIPSQYIHPSEFHVGLHDLGIDCYGKYSYGVKIKHKGSFTASVFNTSANFNISILQSLKYPYIPTAFEVPLCSIDPVNINVKPESKSVSNSELSDEETDLFKTALTSAAELMICNSVIPALLNSTNAFISQVFDPKVIKFIDEGKPSDIPVVSPDISYINWNQFVRLTSLSNYDLSHLANTLINIVTKKSGEISIDLRPLNLIFNKGNLSIELIRLTVSGMNSFSQIQFLHPTSNSNITFAAKSTLESLTFLVSALVTIEESVDRYVGKSEYFEMVTFTIGAQDIKTILSLSIAMQSQKITSLHLDQAVHIGCYLPAIDVFSLNSLGVNLSISNIEYNQVSGMAGNLEKDIATLIDNSLELVTTDLNDFLTSVIYATLQGPVRKQINSDISTFLASVTDEMCPAHYQPEYPVYIRYNESDLIERVSMVMSEHGPIIANAIIDTFTDDGSAVVSFEVLVNDDVEGILTFQMSGLNTVSDIRILEPSFHDAYMLSNWFTIGSCDTSNGVTNLPKPCRLNVTVLYYSMNSIEQNVYPSHSFRTLRLQHSTYRTSEEPIIHFSISLEALKLQMSIKSLFDMARASKLTVDKLAVSGGNGECGIACYSDIVITSMGANVSSADSVSMHGKGGSDVTNPINMLLAYFSRYKQNKFNEAVPSYIASSNATCYGVELPVEPTSDHDATLQVYQVALLIFVCALGVVLSVSFYSSYQLSKLQKNPDYEPTTFESIFIHIGSLMDTISNYFANTRIGKWFYWYNYRASLLGDPRLPFIVRIFLPALAVLTMLIFIWSNSKTDVATVEMEIYIGDIVIKPPVLFSFGLINSISEMWDAKVYALSILIAVMSAAWPQIKLIAMLGAWVLPSNVLSISTREKVLFFLDKYGKWSVVDFYVMLLMMCAFHFKLVLDKSFYVVTYVVPHGGFYAFLLATILSLLVGHAVTAAHRHTVHKDEIRAAEQKKLKRTISPDISESEISETRIEEFNDKSSDAVSSDEVERDQLNDDVEEICREEDCNNLSDNQAIDINSNIVENENAIAEDTIPPEDYRPPRYSDGGIVSVDLSSKKDQMEKRRRRHPKIRRTRTLLKESLISHSFHVFIDQPIVLPINKTKNSEAEYRLIHTSTPNMNPNHYNHTYLVSFTYLGAFSLAILIIGSLLLVLSGSYLRTFVFVFKGMTGLLLKDSSEVSYSLLSVGTAFGASGGSVTPQSAIIWMQSSYYILAFAMPVATLVLCFLAWFVPMTPKSLESLLVWFEVCNAWSAMDVFCVAIVATMLQIEQFAAFIIGDKCDGVNKLIAIFFDEKLHGEDYCFDVIATIDNVSFILFAAAIFLFITSSFSLSCIRRSVSDTHRLVYPSLASKRSEKPIHRGKISEWLHNTRNSISVTILRWMSFIRLVTIKEIFVKHSSGGDVVDALDVQGNKPV